MAERWAHLNSIRFLACRELRVTIMSRREATEVDLSMTILFPAPHSLIHMGSLASIDGARDKMCPSLHCFVSYLALPSTNQDDD
jgi:hypothetical protein